MRSSPSADGCWLGRGRIGARLVAASVAAATVACGWWTGPRGPNVVLVVIDTLRQDRLPFYGYHRMTAPVMSRLAAGGFVYDAVSPSSWTKPAVASLLTGMHPVRHQTLGRLDVLPAPVSTLAELLEQRGYRTAAASANGWISRDFGFAQGFDTLLDVTPKDPGQAPASGDEVNEAVFPVLADLRPPFFLYVHYVDPHSPYAPSRAWNGAPLGARLKQRGRVGTEQLEALSVMVRAPDLMADVSDLYDGEVRQVDDALGALLARLDALKLSDDTVLIVTSDHGEELEDHGRVGHGQTLYEEVVRVPLVVYGPPRIPAGRRAEPVSLIDVFATVVRLAGARVPRGGEGADSVPLPFDPGGHARSFLLHLDMADFSPVGQVSHASLGWISGSTKLLLTKAPQDKELYDLRDGPREGSNLIGIASHERTASSMAEQMVREYNRVAASALTRVIGSADAEQQRRLIALGYLGATPSSEPRLIPDRIEAPDLDPAGMLGWERSGRLQRCLNLGEAVSERQLVRGWFHSERSGRWSSPEASALLPTPSRGGMGTMKLTNHRSDRFTLRLMVDDREVLIQALERPGPVDLSFPVPLPPGAKDLIVRLAVEPPFRPSEHGMADRRELGVFVTTICVP